MSATLLPSICCCEITPCPDPGECGDCPVYLSFFGSVYRRIRDDNGEVAADDYAGDVHMGEAQVRGKLMQDCIISIVDGQCCRVTACTWAGYSEILSPNTGWYYNEDEVLAGSGGTFGLSITVGGIGTGYSFSGSCPVGTYDNDSNDPDDTTSISVVSRSFGDPIDSCCRCPVADCEVCEDCSNGPSELDAVIVVGGSPIIIPGYREADSPCLYLLDTDPTYNGSYLQYQAADAGPPATPDRFFLHVESGGVTLFEGWLACTSNDVNQMLGLYTKTAGTATSGSVT